MKQIQLLFFKKTPWPRLARLLLLNMALAFLTVGAVSAQEIQVAGKVVDSLGGAPLPGVSILVPGASTGTSTDALGSFSITVSDTSRVLSASMLGFRTKLVEIPKDGELIVRLAPDQQQLNQVVVVGYGTERKKDLTGAISTVSAEEVGGRKTLQVSQALQGTMAGVSVTRDNGAPGGGAGILIRGITTIGENSPLIIVDGVPVNNIDNVNPNDVENISVLKDAASAAIYGSRGAAGVVLITTKRAGEGQASFEYNYEYGIQTPTALPEYTEVADYMRYFNEFLVNDGGTPLYDQSLIDHYRDDHLSDPDKYPATDWQDVILSRHAPRQRHDLVFTMGTARIKTKASFGYSLSDALYDNRSYERYQLRVNNDMQINDKLRANLDIFFKRSASQDPAGENPVYAARVMPGIYDDYYQDGRLAPGKDGRNPVAQVLEGGLNQRQYNQIGGRLAFNYSPVTNLTLSAMVSPTFDLNKEKQFSKVIDFTALEDPGRIIASNQALTTLSESRPYNFYINGQLLAAYTQTVNQAHRFDVLAGYEENYYYNESLTAARDGFTVTDFPYLNLGSLEFRNNSGAASESALRSFFGRVKYDFKGKYYLQANLRYDQSSRFSAQHRDALFPSFSAGWTLSEENFMKDLNALSFLKLRGSWGLAGNERIGNYPYQATIAFNNALFYQGNEVVPQGTGAQVAYAVDDISWETTQSFDLGLDAAFIKGQLNLTADYFYKKTRDILLLLDIPDYIGYDNPFQNAGVVAAKGWELEAGWSDRAGKLDYSVSLNLSDTKTEIVDLKGTQFRGDQAKLEGGAFDEWFGYRSSGLFQTPEEVEASPVLNVNTKPGDVKYMDINGDGQITPEGDKVLLGGSLPRYIYGGNIRLSYNGFDLSLVFQGVGKRLSKLSNMQVQPFLENFGNVPMEITGRYWSPLHSAEANLRARYPRLSRASNSNNYQMSDFWLYNGSYFRMKNITLGYTLNAGFIQKIGLQSVRIYLAANDLFALSRSPQGWDPEVGASAYPVVSTIMTGASIQF